TSMHSETCETVGGSSPKYRSVIRTEPILTEVDHVAVCRRPAINSLEPPPISINMDDSKSNSCTAPWNEDCASRSPDNTTGLTPRTSSTAPENSSASAASRAADVAQNR